MESKWLDDFLALAQHKSFSRAADVRMITQSALSRRIRLFEDWIGVQLFDRRSHPTTLTAAGEQLLPRAEEVRKLIENLRADVRAPYFPASEVLTVCMLNTLSLTVFPQLVARLTQAGEHFRFRFADVRTSAADNAEALRSGASDFLCIYAHENVSYLSNGLNLPYIILAEERGIPVSVPDAVGRPLHDLYQTEKPVDFLSYRSHSFFADALPEVIQRGQFRLNTVYESAVSSALLAAAQRGLGVCWVPESLVAEDLKSGRLVRAAPESYDLHLEVRIYRPLELDTRIKERFWRKIAAIAPL